MTERCGLTKSGDCLGGCDPKKRCSYPPARPWAPTVARHDGKVREIEEVELPEEDDPSAHPLDCTCIFCIPGA